MFREILYAIIILLFSSNINAQKISPEVFLNHVYFVLDSNTYAHVFDSAFLQQMGDTSENKVTTADDSWSGKYFQGRNSYFEIFPPNGFENADVGDLGFGFITLKKGDIDKLEKSWKDYSMDTVKRDTSAYVLEGKKYTWYYSIYLSAPDSLLSVAAWVMENTTDVLKDAGFTEEEMKNPITWQEYRERKTEKKFNKAFNRISSVELVTNNNEYTYLKRSFLGFGLKEEKSNFHNDNVSIKYSIANIPSTRLKKIVIELNKSFDEHTIVMSDRLIMHIKNTTASLVFNY